MLCQGEDSSFISDSFTQLLTPSPAVSQLISSSACWSAKWYLGWGSVVEAVQCLIRKTPLAWSNYPAGLSSSAPLQMALGCNLFCPLAARQMQNLILRACEAPKPCPGAKSLYGWE